ncbi:unnamed protein product [Kluyveromyces dobzhanskii CBS 2104]|uniref:WGS project CCBQ000000000 data, contig 00058 n=1 Tax=Kluyveromyces dobzhanskii CBS 2104 TaxID=1427455 RepID=A0A0A8LDW5_9SACH|nr:unnamed protein product [Kluyveromyces dobzhanskii CBS 2104]
MSEDKPFSTSRSSILEDYEVNDDMQRTTEIVDVRDLGMIGEIIQGILDFLNSPAFATIVQIIQQIIELIIGAFSLVSFLGYHGFQDEVVRQYISSTCFFVAITGKHSNLFSNAMHFMILIFNFYGNAGLPNTDIDWRKIILQIILWIIQRLLDSSTGKGYKDEISDSNSETISLLPILVKAISIMICLRSILT